MSFNRGNKLGYIHIMEDSAVKVRHTCSRNLKYTLLRKRTQTKKAYVTFWKRQSYSNRKQLKGSPRARVSNKN
jgi:hypothetical protein